VKHLDLLQISECGLYCSAGDFYIDPLKPVNRAVITHAHADHARWGCTQYLASTASSELLKARLGADIRIQTIDYGAPLQINGVRLSLHPAGHILGSAQIRLEHGGRIWVVSGDFKREPDATCASFEPVRCHTFVTESTFGLPVFRWRPQQDILAEISTWWQGNRAAHMTSILFAYSLGKAQRILAGLKGSAGPIFTHGAVEKMVQCYRQAGVKLAATRYVGQVSHKNEFPGSLVIAPPSADVPQWTRQFGPCSKAFASGWMQIRGNRRRRAIDRGFVLSDHSDWHGLVETCTGTGAESIWVTHGFSSELVRWLNEKGLQATSLETRFGAERQDEE
jgi:putative mRNA 3-end processing factor